MELQIACGHCEGIRLPVLVHILFLADFNADSDLLYMHCTKSQFDIKQFCMFTFVSHYLRYLAVNSYGSLSVMLIAVQNLKERDHFEHPDVKGRCQTVS